MSENQSSNNNVKPPRLSSDGRSVSPANVTSNRKYGSSVVTSRFKYSASRFVSDNKFGIMRGILFFMLVSVLFMSLNNIDSDYMTFTYFLGFMKSVPSIPTDWIGKFSSLFTTNNIFGLNSGLRLLLSTLSAPISLLLYLVVGILQLLVYARYILFYFFGMAVL